MLLLWTRAGVGLNGNAAASIANQEKLTCTFAQATPSAQPTFIGSPSYGGQPSLHFVAASSQTLTASLDLFVTGPYTIFGIWKCTNGVAGVCSVALGGNLQLGTVNSSGNKRNVHHGGVSAHEGTATQGTNLERWLARYAPGAGPTLLVDGVAVPLNNASTSGLISSGNLSLASRAGAFYADLDLVLVAAFTSTVPDSVAYRLNKFGKAMYRMAA